MNLAFNGCFHGEIEKVYETMQYIEKSNNVKIDALICCGDFQAIRNEVDLNHMHCPKKYASMGTFHEYYSGKKVAPYLTIIIGGNHEASNYFRELYFGGWVAPNMYYLGTSGSIILKKGDSLRYRLSGMSGIFKINDFFQQGLEKYPLDNNTKISIYHTKQIDTFKLSLLKEEEIDIFLSHDWPTKITKHGNQQLLFRIKPFFEEEALKEILGNPAHQFLLDTLKPAYWFAGHLHVKFAALVRHIDGKKTKFLALDKCLPRRQFLQIVNYPDNEVKKVDLLTSVNGQNGDEKNIGEIDIKQLDPSLIIQGNLKKASEDKSSETKIEIEKKEEGGQNQETTTDKQEQENINNEDDKEKKEENKSEQEIKDNLQGDDNEKIEVEQKEEEQVKEGEQEKEGEKVKQVEQAKEGEQVKEGEQKKDEESGDVNKGNKAEETQQQEQQQQQQQQQQQTLTQEQQIQQMFSTNQDSPSQLKLEYDPAWLAILKATTKEFIQPGLLTKYYDINQQGSEILPNDEAVNKSNQLIFKVREYKKEFEGKELAIPDNFQVTAQPYDQNKPDAGFTPDKVEINNQTKDLLELIGAQGQEFKDFLYYNNIKQKTDEELNNHQKTEVQNKEEIDLETDVKKEDSQQQNQNTSTTESQQQNGQEGEQQQQQKQEENNDGEKQQEKEEESHLNVNKEELPFL